LGDFSCFGFYSRHFYFIGVHECFAFQDWQRAIAKNKRAKMCGGYFGYRMEYNGLALGAVATTFRLVVKICKFPFE
tara:strand:- start:5152 stop:5379 length:228 start_codon:yes stop_codon:yes gene_type:complete